MGVWGTGISSNDTFADTYEQFIELYNEGGTSSEITSKLIEENKNDLETIPEDAPNFWYAVAKAQWECKALELSVLERVEYYIQSGEDLKIWKELGGTPADLAARKIVLEKFLTKLKTERKSPRLRRRKKLYDSVFRAGDCLVYRMENGNFGGAFVLTEEFQTEAGVNYIAITTLDTKGKPALEDFSDAEIYVRVEDLYRFDSDGLLIKSRGDAPQIAGFYAMSFETDKLGIEVVGRFRIRNPFKIERIVGYGWQTLQNLVPKREQYEREHGKPTSRLFLTEWIEPYSRFNFRRWFRR